MGTYGTARVSKSFSGVAVLNEISFEIRSGEVHALLGENGSGKSTLIKVLGGVFQPSGGHVQLDGKEITLQSPAHAKGHGLAIVHQDYEVFPELDVATNVAMGGRLPVRRFLRTIDRREMRRRAGTILASLGLRIDPMAPLHSLGLAEWKLVECARALLGKPSFLILDEPTALLDVRDSNRILTLIERLRSEGIGIAFVSHRLDEALRVADRITILRDGKLAGSLPRTGVTAAALIPYIVGTKALSNDVIDRGNRPTGEPVLSITGVEALAGASSFDLVVPRGEILGLTGLIGSGALEVARMIAGRQPLRGTIAVGGKERRIRSPRDAIRVGIGYIPEERTEFGLVMDMSVELNINLASLPDVSRGGLVRRRLLESRARRYGRAVTINAPSLRAPVRTLSGGNQQKVQLAKWLAPHQDILVIESPTHGVDVGAKAEIHRLLREFAANGGTIVVASTDIPEVLAIADRVAVFNRGDLVAVMEASEGAHGEILLGGAVDKRLSDIERLLER